MLEGIPQRELDQARRAHGAVDLAKSPWVLEVSGCRISKVGVIPEIEEIGGEAQILALGQAEVLDEREIPILLERSAIDITTERAELRRASRAGGVGRATGGVGGGGGGGGWGGKGGRPEGCKVGRARRA